MDETPYISLDRINIDTDTGEPVFKNLSFKLVQGRSATITGGAGSGKTMLTELLIGERFVVTGTVQVFGKELRRGKKRTIRQLRRKIGGVGGIFELMPNLSVGENIEYPLIIDAVPRKHRREQVVKTLSDLALLKYSGMYPRSLTRVQNTLVQIGRASIANQPLVIIDEPFAGLDPTTYTKVTEHLEHITLSGRSLLVLSSTPLPQFLPNCDDYRFQDGELRQ